MHLFSVYSFIMHIPIHQKMPTFEENIKISFAKVKEDIQRLESKLQNLQSSLEKIEKFISSIQEAQSPPTNQISPKTINLPPESDISTGNNGVYSFIHSLFIHSCTSQKEQKIPYSALTSLKEDLQKTFNSLSNQEFLAFLTVYHLEDELGKVTYPLLAKTLNLSEGCIRTYISSLIRKGLPLLKIKPNNRTTLLSISQDFRALNLKKSLSDLYYAQTDLSQRHLDNF